MFFFFFFFFFASLTGEGSKNNKVSNSESTQWASSLNPIRLMIDNRSRKFVDHRYLEIWRAKLAVYVGNLQGTSLISQASINTDASGKADPSSVN
ncbi:hypothetical protein GGR53DRAFT_483621, partial [Hypoxylon sp. FL1150]